MMAWHHGPHATLTLVSLLAGGCARLAGRPEITVENQTDRYGRGERDSPSLTQQRPAILLINLTRQRAAEASA
jgi:hypothetical protein